MLGGFLFLGGIIALVATRSKGGLAIDERETVVSKEEMEQLKATTQKNVEAATRSFDIFLHYFVVRGETKKGIVIRVIGGVVAGAIAANTIHWAVMIINLLARVAFSDASNYDDMVLLFYEYGVVVESIGAALVLWYALRQIDMLVAFRNIFGVGLVSYLLWLMVIQIFFGISESAFVELLIGGLICTFGLVLAVWSQRRTRIQA